MFSFCHVTNVSICVLVEFAKLIQIMWTSTSSEAVSPSEFKTQIQRYAPRFVGYKYVVLLYNAYLLLCSIDRHSGPY